MGCLQSKDETAEDERSRSIDMRLKQDANAEKQDIKLLLLGAGESGKTTIKTQMRYIEGSPPSEEEKEQFTDVCRTNMISSLQVILDNMLLFGIPLADSSLKGQANLIVSLENEYGSVGLDSDTGDLLPGVLEAVLALWADANVQETVKTRSNEFQLNDSAEYFLDSAARIGAKDWKPNAMDVLKARVKTTGVSVTSFVKMGRKFDVVDVGGQRSERRKWLHCFDNVTCLLYVVALNEYNMMLREDESVNRMDEALTLYHSIVTSPFFKSISVILFLNKADLLRRKCRSGLQVNMINQNYPDFKGDPTDWKAVFKFIEKMFVDTLKASDVTVDAIRNKQVYPHMCTAIDQEDMRAVLSSVSDIVIRGNMQTAGLL